MNPAPVELTQLETQILLRILRVTIAQHEEVLMQLQEQRRAGINDPTTQDAMLSVDNYLAVLRSIRSKFWLNQIG